MGSFKKIDVAGLIVELESKDDPRQAYARVLKEVEAHKAAGAPVPADLERYRKTLMVELASMSQGR